MKVFITVNMDPYIKAEVARQLPSIRSKYSEGKWVPKENWHVTLLYLGEVEDIKLILVQEAMKEAVKGIETFSLKVEGMGVFPNEKNPKILWAGIDGNRRKLNQLYQQIVTAVDKKKLPYDAKPVYKPHLTLARKIKDGLAHKEMKLSSSSWKVDSLGLYQSVSHPTGVQYKKIFAIKLGNNE